MSDEHSEIIRRLKSIADALGMSVHEVSSRENTHGNSMEASELLQLWFAIRAEDGRRRALECLRRIVDDEQR